MVLRVRFGYEVAVSIHRGLWRGKGIGMDRDRLCWCSADDAILSPSGYKGEVIRGGFVVAWNVLVMIVNEQVLF
jgi:hypothetical protein